MASKPKHKILLSKKDMDFLSKRLNRFLREITTDWDLESSRSVMEELCGFSSSDERTKWEANHSNTGVSPLAAGHAAFIQEIRSHELVDLFFCFADSSINAEKLAQARTLLAGASLKFVQLQNNLRSVSALRELVSWECLLKTCEHPSNLQFPDTDGAQAFYERYWQSLGGGNGHSIETSKTHCLNTLLLDNLFNLLESVDSDDFMVFNPKWDNKQTLPHGHWLQSEPFMTWQATSTPSSVIKISDLLRLLVKTADPVLKRKLIRVIADLTWNYAASSEVSAQLRNHNRDLNLKNV